MQMNSSPSKVFNFIILLAVGLLTQFSLIHESKSKGAMPFGGVEVKVLTRKNEHIKTAALICALHEAKDTTKDQIKAAWTNYLKKPISSNDQFLITRIMKEMCPEIKLKEPYVD